MNRTREIWDAVREEASGSPGPRRQNKKFRHKKNTGQQTSMSISCTAGHNSQHPAS